MARIPRKSLTNSCTSKGYSLSHLWERHKEIARLLVSGVSQQEIAKRLSLSESWVSIVCNSPIFQQYLSSLRGRVEVGLADVRATINEGAVQSATLLLNMLKKDDVNHQTKAKIAFDFLDRAGYGAIKTVRNENLTVTMTSSDIEEIKQNRERLLEKSRLASLSSSNQQVIDVTP